MQYLIHGWNMLESSGIIIPNVVEQAVGDIGYDIVRACKSTSYKNGA